jgi:hypothetical protein
MDLDMLQSRWIEQDARLDRMLRLNHHMLRALELGHTRSALQRFQMAVWGQLLIDAVAALALGIFMGQHYREPRFLAPAVALLAFVVIVIMTAARQLAMLAGIDHDGPVTDMQRRLETLRALRVRVTIWIAVSAAMLWVPIFIVLLKGGVGLSVYDWFPDWVLVLNIGVGAALVPIAFWASRRFADTLGSHPIAQRIARDLAGTSLNAAQDQLAKLAAFEREDPA